MLWIGVLPALAVVYVRYYVKEPDGLGREPAPAARPEAARSACRCSASSSRGMIGNTLTACWWMASDFVIYYSI